MQKDIRAEDLDTKQAETFIWIQDDSSKILPIDYSERELAEKLGIGTRKVRSHLITNSPMKGTLENMIMEKDGEKYHPLPVERKIKRKKNNSGGDTSETESVISCKGAQKIPLPLEAIPFLEAYLKLETTTFQNVFQHGYEGREERISAFVQALCRELADIVLPGLEADQNLAQKEETSTAEAKDIGEFESEFMRHALFNNDTFNDVLFDDLWENEFQTRLDRMRERVRNLPSNERSSFLKNILITLDRYAISLPVAGDTSPHMSLYNEADLEKLFNDLLIERGKVITGRGGLAMYKIRNSKFGKAGQEVSMQEAFQDLSRCRKRRNANDRNRVRIQYLRHLGAATEPSPAEEKYMDLHKYLEGFPKTKGSIEKAFFSSMKKWGQVKIDYCTQMTFDCLIDYGVLEDSHVKSLINTYALEKINWFWPTIELTRTLYIMKETLEYDTTILRNIIRSKADELWVDSDDSNKGSDILSLIQQITAGTLRQAADEFKKGDHKLASSWAGEISRQYMDGFLSCFRAACVFLYGSECAYVSEKGIANIEKASIVFGSEARTAAEFFDRAAAFPHSDEKVAEMLVWSTGLYENPDDTLPLGKLVDVASKLLMGVLLQTFRKIAVDSTEKEKRIALLSSLINK